MSRGKVELEDFLRRWLKAHPGPVDDLPVGYLEGMSEVDPASGPGQTVGALVTPGALVTGPLDYRVLSQEELSDIGEASDRPHAIPCAATPRADCDARPRCTGCPAYASWREKVRSPTGGA